MSARPAAALGLIAFVVVVNAAFTAPLAAAVFAKHLLTLCSEIGDLASDVRHSESSSICAMFVPCCSLATGYCLGTTIGRVF